MSPKLFESALCCLIVPVVCLTIGQAASMASDVGNVKWYHRTSGNDKQCECEKGADSCPEDSDGANHCLRNGHFADLRNTFTGTYNSHDEQNCAIHFRIVDEMDYRIYTAKQMQNLFSNVRELEIVETYDFSYDIDDPVTIGPQTEDVVFVLRKK